MSNSSYEQKQDKAWARELHKVWGALATIEKAMEEFDMTNLVVKQVVIQGPEVTGGGFRAIIKGRDESGRLWVSFRDGQTVAALNQAIAAGLADGSLRWREDLPYGQGGKGAVRGEG